MATSTIPPAERPRGNSPNPFNESSTIGYDLPARTHVRLDAFNFLGRQVRTLLDAQQEAGTHAVRFDAADLPSGAYLYRIRAGHWTTTRILVLMK